MAQPLSGLLKNQFGGNAKETLSTLAKRTRVDARTVGYPHGVDNSKVVWAGMTPAEGAGDLWRVVEVEEEFNQRLTHVNENERLVDIDRGNEQDPPLSFEKALERLAIWEFSKMQAGALPVQGQNAGDLGQIYFKELAKRRNLLVSTVGETATAPGGFIPANGRHFLKTDIERLKDYHEKIEGGDVLGELLRAREPMYVSETSIEEDIASFGEINSFDKMQFLANILVEYAKLKLKYMEEFYGNPTKMNREDIGRRINDSGFFSEDLLRRFNELRQELAFGIFRLFHVKESDWDEILDFSHQSVQVAMRRDPAVKDTYDMLTREVKAPLDESEIKALTLCSAYGLLFFKHMIKDSAQKDALERASVYSQGDIDDLLNFLDLLDIKLKYADLAKLSTALPGTPDYKKVKKQQDDCLQSVADLKANLKSTGDFSAVQERQIDDFIKAGAPVYLLERIKTLPERLGKAYQFVADRILPKPHQLTLDLDYSQCNTRIAAPTRAAREDVRSAMASSPAKPAADGPKPK